MVDDGIDVVIEVAVLVAASVAGTLMSSCVKPLLRSKTISINSSDYNHPKGFRAKLPHRELVKLSRTSDTRNS